MQARSVILVAAALVGLAVPAHAEDRAEAEHYFRLGEKAYQAQDFEAAAAQFEEAYKKYDLPEIAFSAAQSYRRLYRIQHNPAHVARAVELYQVYLAKRTNGGRVADAADALGEMQHELEKLLAAGVVVSPELAKEHTRLSINVSFGTEQHRETGNLQEVGETRQETVAEIAATLDGKPVKTLMPINVPPGSHRVVVSARGFFTGETRIEVPQGATKIADVMLAPMPGRVTVATEAGARITVDGRLASNAPGAPLELPAGKHLITLSMRGRIPIAREVTVGRGDEITMRAPMETTLRRRAVPWFVAGGGATVAVTAVSATFAYLRDSDASDLLVDIRAHGDNTEADRARYDRLRGARDHWRTATYMSGAATVGLLGVAALLYYTDNRSPDGVRVEPLTVPAGGGAAIAGRF